MKEIPCGCCEGTEILTPQTTANRPGLSALAYRAGTHGTFLQTMLARLSSADYPALAGLTTRDVGDPSIALLDAWALVADVLTFYQARIANEGYLLTATERRSILELARLVGYRLRPGVAASVFLAFELDKDAAVEIPAGTRAQSLPGPGELPQPFETAEPILARGVWNALKPRLTRPPYITTENVKDVDTLYFAGTATNLKPNDPLLFVFDSKQALGWIESVERDAAQDRTKVMVREVQIPAETKSYITTEDTSEIRQIIEGYRNLEQFKISDETAMARKVLGFLDRLESGVATDVPIDRVTRVIEETLQGLQPELELAEERSYTNLAPWVGGLVTDLEAVQGRLTTDPNASETATRMSSASENLGSSNQMMSIIPKAPILAAVDTVLSKLITPLIPPPSHAVRLTRAKEATFAPESDIPLRLLTTFKPTWQKALYRALAGSIVTEPSKLENVYALRVKAAPFGHNAPPRPDHYDKVRNQTVFGEWEIYDPLNTQITPPTADFVACPPTGQVPLKVQFADRSTGHVTKWVWNFGDGTKGTNRDPDHIYQDPGTYNVSLTVSSPCGSSTESKTITCLDAAPINAAFTAEPIRGTLPLEVKFTDRSSGEITRWEWDFGGIGKSAEKNPTFTFERAGTHTVTLTVSGPEGESMTQALVVVEEKFVPPLKSLARTTTAADTAPCCHTPTILYLDAEYNIQPDGWVVVRTPDRGDPIIFTPEQVTQQSLAAYGISGRATRLDLGEEEWFDAGSADYGIVRGTTVYAKSENLALAEEPILSTVGHDPDNLVAGKQIQLDGLYDGLTAGRWLIVSGERADIKDEFEETVSGIPGVELVMIAEVTQGVQQVQANGEEVELPGDTLHTVLHLANSLAYSYKRDTVTLYGNVAKATHGETREEALGSGDGSQGLQAFALKQSPLTYLAAPTPAGAESTLEVRVNDVRWHESERLVDRGPKDRIYVTRTDDEDKTTVLFGDGKHGARLPTGVENVKAKYRSGIGQAGNLPAEQISLLATRPLGVKGVINPLPSTGGADRESRDQARRNAPLGVTALDRLVSVQDYADFCRSFAGIGKARAAHLTAGWRQLVHVTIAGADDIPIDEQSDLYHNLIQALHQHGDPHLPLQVDLRELAFVVISANVRLLPDYLWESVEPQIRSALLEALGFDRRALGQDVLLGEVIRTVQGVPGVAYVDVDILGAIPEKKTDENGNRRLLTPEEIVDEVEKIIQASTTTGGPPSRIPAGLAEAECGTIRPAQLAYLTADVSETLMLTELN